MRLVIDDIYSENGRSELVCAYVKSLWSSGVHNRACWLGVPILQLPEDMIILADLIWRTRPTVVVEIGIWNGGGLVLYASLLEMIGHGRVVGVDVDVSRADRITGHPLACRIKLVRGDSTSSAIVKAAMDGVSKEDRVMVVLDSNHSSSHVRKELEAYSPFVGHGCYMAVLDGIMNILHDVPGGHPSWKTDNPETAVADFLKTHTEFARDASCNRLGATFAPGGYLRRTLS